MTNKNLIILIGFIIKTVIYKRKYFIYAIGKSYFFYVTHTYTPCIYQLDTD